MEELACNDNTRVTGSEIVNASRGSRQGIFVLSCGIYSNVNYYVFPYTV